MPGARRLTVLLHNLDLPAGEVSAVVSTEGALRLAPAGGAGPAPAAGAGVGAGAGAGGPQEAAASPAASPASVRLTATLATGAQALPSTRILAAEAGRGVVRLEVSGPN